MVFRKNCKVYFHNINDILATVCVHGITFPPALLPILHPHPAQILNGVSPPSGQADSRTQQGTIRILILLKVGIGVGQIGPVTQQGTIRVLRLLKVRVGLGPVHTLRKG